MYARVLLIGRAPLGDASPVMRVRDALRRQGHAVQPVQDPDEGGSARALRAACASFEPTVVLWDIASVPAVEGFADALAALACPKVAWCATEASAAVARDRGADGMFDVIAACDARVLDVVDTAAGDGPRDLRFPPAVDVPYSNAGISRPNLESKGALCAQPVTGDARERLEDAAHAAGGPAVALHPDAERPWGYDHPGADPAYWARTTRCAVYLAGAGADGSAGIDLDCLDAALRVAEGNVVLVEDGAARDASGAGGDAPAAPEGAFERSLVRVEPGGLGDAVRALEADPSAYARALDAQRSALSRVSLGDILDRVLHAAEARAGLRGGSVLSRKAPATSVVVYGWLGAHNFGDDLLLDVVSARIRRHYENAQVMVVGADPASLRCREGVEAAAPHQKAILRDWLGFARAVVFCGGLIFDEPMAQTAGELEIVYDPWIEPSGQAAVSMLARLHGVPSVYLGIGTGPVELSATKAAVRAMGSAGSVMLPRDADARADLDAAGFPAGQVQDAADLVLGSRERLLELAGSGERGGGERGGGGARDGRGGHDGSGYFVVSLRDWSLNPPDFERRMAGLVDALIDRFDLDAVFLPYDADDVAIHGRVRDQMTRRDRAEVLGRRPETPELLGWMADERFCLAMRLHCSIISHVLGRRAMGIDYNNKIGAYYRQMGQTDVLLPLGFDGDAAAAAVDALADDSESRLARVKGEVEARAKLVERAFDRLYREIDGADPLAERRPVFYPRVISRFEEDAILQRQRAERAEAEIAGAREAVERAHAEVEQARRDADAARGDVLAVRASRSYRLGNAVMRIPAAIKRLLERG